jgi:hypothetical protein
MITVALCYVALLATRTGHVMMALRQPFEATRRGTLGRGSGRSLAEVVVLINSKESVGAVLYVKYVRCEKYLRELTRRAVEEAET